MNRKAAKLLEKELKSYRQLLALEINKAKWLDAGDFDQAESVQAKSNKAIDLVKRFSELFDDLPENERPSEKEIQSDPKLNFLHGELSATIDKIVALNDRNQQKVRDLMVQMLDQMKNIGRSRQAMRGYHSGTDHQDRLLDGKL